MKATNLVAELAALIEQHGDLEIGLANDEFGCSYLSRHVKHESSNFKEKCEDDFERDSEDLGDHYFLID